MVGRGGEIPGGGWKAPKSRKKPGRAQGKRKQEAAINITRSIEMRPDTMEFQVKNTTFSRQFGTELRLWQRNQQ